MTDREILDSMNPRDKEIVLAFADNGMRPSFTAKGHYLSHQGVDYHLRKVRANTGLDPRNFYQLYKLAMLIKQEREDYGRERS